MQDDNVSNSSEDIVVGIDFLNEDQMERENQAIETMFEESKITQVRISTNP